MPHHLQNLTLCNPEHPLHSKQVDLLIETGIITRIASERIETPGGFEKFDAKGAHAIPSLMDTGAWIGDPGFEPMEDLESASNAALAGGYNTIAVLPETNPVLQNKSAVEYYRQRSQGLPVEFYPIGALTEKLQGENMAELYDMKAAGAIAFSNAWRSTSGHGVLLRALQYSRPFDGLVVVFPDDKGLSAGGQMHEGTESVILGMKGMPALAEEMAIKNALDVAVYSGAPLHFSRISTKGAVELIRVAKKQGLHVTCDVAVMNLVATDAWLADYDTNLKLMPPLRSEEDVDTLKAGLMDGTIDAISSDHCPKDPEHKVLEFDYAAFGAIGLQTLLPLLVEAFGKKLKPEMIARWCSSNPRKIFRLPEVKIAENASSAFMIFDPSKAWTFDDHTNRSKSQNSFYFGKNLKGAAIATFSKGTLYLNF